LKEIILIRKSKIRKLELTNVEKLIFHNFLC